MVELYVSLFCVSNGARREGILLTLMIFLIIYIRVKLDVIKTVCVSHVMYADDICLMAPSPAALQKLINVCYDFSVQNTLLFNSSKSFCMVFKPRLYKLSCPS